MRRRRERLLGLLLIAGTLAVYAQVVQYDFVLHDDPAYVRDNPYVRSGLAPQSVTWALTTTHGSNFHPLMWLSLMLDTALYGPRPGGYHLTNVILHLANTLLLFALWRRMTGAVSGSATVAALFALHPLHVQSVAWISERKDVLSTLFLLLTLSAYVRYAQGRRRDWYLVALFCFVLGLMAKPMLVTLPFLLLLLDWWPLRRVAVTPAADGCIVTLLRERRAAIRLVLEKVPFLILAAGASAVTFVAQQRHANVVSADALPIADRIAHALVSYVRYLGKALWPNDLAFFYPYAPHLPQWQIIGSAVIVVAVSLFALSTTQRRGYVTVGWFWYVGALVPVIGLVQIGEQSMADHYAYVPVIGIYVLVVWGMADLLPRWPSRARTLATAASAMLVTLMVVSWHQVRHWRNAQALAEHAVAVTENNYLAHYTLGIVLERAGRFEDAVSHYQAALRSNPRDWDAHNNLGSLLARQGHLDEARRHYDDALRLRPDFANAHYNLGLVLDAEGRSAEALAQYEAAARLEPTNAIFRRNRAAALARLGRIPDPVAGFDAALR